MDKNIQEKIKELRISGLGYKKIAAIVGVSVGNVRYYCKTHNMAGVGSELKLFYEEPGSQRKYCKQCGNEIVRLPHSGKKLFCCELCRRKWWKENAKEAHHNGSSAKSFKCLTCGKIILVYGKKPARKYCSHECYIKDRFWSKAYRGRRETISMDANCKLHKINSK